MMYNVFMDYGTAKNTLPQSNEVSIVVSVGRVDVGLNQVGKDIYSFGFGDVNVLTMDL